MIPMPHADAHTRTHILVVEDDADTARSMALLLEHFGHEVEVARDGPQAIAAARRRRPDFVLLDLGLPLMDGHEVARRLRQEAGCRQSILIAVTGYGQEEDRQRSRMAGIDHHLLKPADPGVLLPLLSRPPASPDADGGSTGDSAAAAGGGATGASPD
jgi:CheY-like chemotaxis protein